MCSHNLKKVSIRYRDMYIKHTNHEFFNRYTVDTISEHMYAFKLTFFANNFIFYADDYFLSISQLAATYCI
jgi:hypothetical protein